MNVSVTTDPMPHDRVNRRARSALSPLALVTTIGLALLLAFMTVVLLHGGPAQAQTQTTAGTVRLTFDDGPVYGNTTTILDILGDYGVQATFFVVGEQARRYPDLVWRAYSEGHSVQNHTYTHPDLTYLSNAEIEWEFRATNRAIRAAGVPKPYLFRPPYGATDARVGSVGAYLGLTQTLWTVDSRDWEDPPAWVICNRVVSSVGPGSIVLLHDGAGANTANALPCIITELRERGYGFGTL